jgi:hypothetical protein
MTVAELIEKLKQFDPNLPVVIADGCDSRNLAIEIDDAELGWAQCKKYERGEEKWHPHEIVSQPYDFYDHVIQVVKL